jgi:hypothetical protein
MVVNVDHPRRGFGAFDVPADPERAIRVAA